MNTDRHRPPMAIPTQSSSSPSMQDESCQTDDEQLKTYTESHLTDPDLLAHLKAQLEENAAVQEELIELRGSKEGDSEETTTSDHLLQENALLCRRLRTTEQRCLQLVSQMHKRFVQLVMVDRKKSPSSPDHHQITTDIHSWARQLKGELASKFFEEVPEEELWRKLMVGREAEMVAVVVVEGGEGEDMASHCVTVQEYNQLVEDKGRLKQQLISVQERNGAVEEALRVVTDQLEENQRMGNRCWDEEISLRHLVVDLQAEGSEKQLLARAHRELQMGEWGSSICLYRATHLPRRQSGVLLLLLSQSIAVVISGGKTNIFFDFQLFFLLKTFFPPSLIVLLLLLIAIASTVDMGTWLFVWGTNNSKRNGCSLSCCVSLGFVLFLAAAVAGCAKDSSSPMAGSSRQSTPPPSSSAICVCSSPSLFV